MTETFDAIVIGAGAMGAAAAYYLSKRQQKTLVLEQFDLDHRKGSSYGHSRIIRYSYDHPEYVELAKDTFPLWHDVEQELGEQLYVKTGGIDFGPASDPTFRATIGAVQSSNIEHELLGIDEANARFPQFRFTNGFEVLYQPDSGFVRASKAVTGHMKLAAANGAVLREKTAVKSIEIENSRVHVVTDAGNYAAAMLVITAGSWARWLLQDLGIDLPLTPLRCQLNFFSPGVSRRFDATDCPVWIAHVSSLFPETAYGIPSHQGSGFKVAFHGGHPVDHPTQIDYSPDPDNSESLRLFLRSHIPALADAPLQESRICLYTKTPDEHFIVDRHPEYANVAIGAGFSGHGFKFSTIVGKMLSDLVIDGYTSHNDKLFKIKRLLG